MASMSLSSVITSRRSRYGFALGLRHEKRFSMPMASISWLSSSRGQWVCEEITFFDLDA